MIIAVFLHHSINIDLPIVLINTSFVNDKKVNIDREVGKLGFEDLKRKFKERKFIFVENDILYTEFKDKLFHIKKLIYPKEKHIDLNIGSCLYFGSSKAKEFSKVVFLGSGADEVFGGYNRYKNDLKNLKSSLLGDLKNLWEANLGRDDRVISDNGVEGRCPFLDREVIRRSINLPGEYLIRRNGDELIDKFILREILKNEGFERASLVKKKAMQYGSGIYRWERRLKKSTVSNGSMRCDSDFRGDGR
jgi:asparagine synthetase B (glutamine-hydrolysing)